MHPFLAPPSSTLRTPRLPVPANPPPTPSVRPPYAAQRAGGARARHCVLGLALASRYIQARSAERVAVERAVAERTATSTKRAAVDASAECGGFSLHGAQKIVYVCYRLNNKSGHRYWAIRLCVSSVLPTAMCSRFSCVYAGPACFCQGVHNRNNQLRTPVCNALSSYYPMEGWCSRFQRLPQSAVYFYPPLAFACFASNVRSYP